MKDKRNIQNEIDKTLNLIDQVEKVEADPFFYTRVSAKLEKEDKGISFDWLFESSLLKPIIVAFILIINVVTVTHFIGYKNSNLSEDELVDLFNQEYYITQSTDSYLVINEDF